MKATIDTTGLLLIIPETALEGYALNKWVGENIEHIAMSKTNIAIEQFEEE